VDRRVREEQQEEGPAAEVRRDLAGDRPIPARASSVADHRPETAMKATDAIASRRDEDVQEAGRRRHNEMVGVLRDHEDHREAAQESMARIRWAGARRRPPASAATDLGRRVPAREGPAGPPSR
jgi:hypothetical protein